MDRDGDFVLIPPPEGQARLARQEAGQAAGQVGQGGEARFEGSVSRGFPLLLSAHSFLFCLKRNLL